LLRTPAADESGAPFGFGDDGSIADDICRRFSESFDAVFSMAVTLAGEQVLLRDPELLCCTPINVLSSIRKILECFS